MPIPQSQMMLHIKPCRDIVRRFLDYCTSYCQTKSKISLR